MLQRSLGKFSTLNFFKNRKIRPILIQDISFNLLLLFGANKYFVENFYFVGIFSARDTKYVFNIFLFERFFHKKRACLPLPLHYIQALKSAYKTKVFGQKTLYNPIPIK